MGSEAYHNALDPPTPPVARWRLPVRASGFARPPDFRHNGGSRRPTSRPAPREEIVPDRNTQWTIGTFIAVALALSMQISMQISGLRADINQLRNETNQRFSLVENGMNQLRTEINQLRNEMNQRFSEMNRRLEIFDERLRSVEIAFAKVDQRLEIIERVLLPDAPSPPE